MQFAPAFPLWTASIGGAQPSTAIYDTINLDTSGISILDSGAPFGLIEGSYTAVLQAGIGGDTALSQMGVVPTDTQSLIFKALSANGPFAVSMNGQTLPLRPIGTGGNFTLYEADIRAWAAQNALLQFTVFAVNPHVNNNFLYLDAIQFVPEPTAHMWIMAAASLALWLKRRHQ